MKQHITPNRVAVGLTALAGLAGAVAVPVANLDTTSTVGVLGGLVTILGAAVKRLDGWQKHEARISAPAQGFQFSSGTSSTFNSLDTENPDEPGDVLDGLPHHPSKDPTSIAPDEGDAGQEATS